MYWVAFFTGLILLAAALLGPRLRQPVKPAIKGTEPMGALARKNPPVAHSRLPSGRHLQRRLEKTLKILNQEEEPLPSARCLLDNGRYLQQQTAALKSFAPPALPSASRDCPPRIQLFAEKLMDDSQTDIQEHTLVEAAEQWQQQSAFTTLEISLLEPTLRLCLCRLIIQQAELCVQEARERSAAMRAMKAFAKGKKKKAIDLCRRYQQHPAFWEKWAAMQDMADGQPEELAALTDTPLEKLAIQEHERQAQAALWVSNAIQSLRQVKLLPWDTLREALSAAHALLSEDAVYRKMDMESRAYYRQQASLLARRLHIGEEGLCRAALSLCRQNERDTLQGHVGYYLLDDGLADLARKLHSRARGLRFLQKKSLALWRAAEWCGFLGLLAAAVFLLPVWLWLPFAGFTAYFLQQLWISLLSQKVPPRRVPRIQVQALTAENQTLVICHAVLTSARQAREMVQKLSVLQSANPDEHLHFLLLGDFQDSLSGALAGDQELMDAAEGAMEALCREKGRVFFYLQRERVYSAAKHRYVSRGGEPGGLEAILRLLNGQNVSDAFACATVDPQQLSGQYRYVIFLGRDTLLPPGSALQLVGAMLHPLQKRQTVQGRMHGVSIIQPRMETNASAFTNRLTLFLNKADDTKSAAFDQNVLAHGTYMGTGIIDLASFDQAAADSGIPFRTFDSNLLKGEIAGCAFAGDIVLYKGQPEGINGLMARLYRRTQREWRLLPYVLPFFPKRLVAPAKPLDAAGKHQIWRGLFRSLIAPLRALLLILGAAAGIPWLWAMALLLPELFCPRPRHQAFQGALCRLAVLPCQVGTLVGAIFSSLTHRLPAYGKPLVWQHNASFSQTGPEETRPSMRFFYFNMAFGAAQAVLMLLPGACRVCGWSLALLWIAFPFVLPLLEQPFTDTAKPTGYMREVLGRIAKNTLLFFETGVTEQAHFLPPDHIQIEPEKGIATHTSPAGIGLYLCSLIAAEKLRLLSPEEAAVRISQTADTLEKLSKWKGMLYSHYDTRTLQPLSPAYVSAADNGTLAVCLLCCAQGIRAMMREVSGAHSGLSARLDALAQAMQLSALYDSKADLFYLGYSPENAAFTQSHHECLASETRLLSFAAILLGQAPVKHWFRLERQPLRLGGGRCGLLSPNGSMAAYMMPLLFLPSTRGTLLHNACRQALRVQSHIRLGKAFGISESGYYAFDPELVYQYKAFGAARLAADMDIQQNVLAPHATLLAMPMALKACFHNLLRLQNLGLEGPLGLFESADFGKARTDGRKMRIVRSYLSHHQGMILCAICNVLEEGYLTRLFVSLPKVQAYSPLLEEGLSRPSNAVRKPFRKRRTDAQADDFFMEREAKPLRFPVDAHLLSGGGTTMLVDAQGGGFIQHDGVLLTRFHESCRIPSGIRFYLRDSQSGAVWSVADPYLCQSARFETAQAIFTHQRFDVECQLRVWINPLDGAVLHMMTLTNHTAAERMMEVCSYLEPALCTQQEETAQPGEQAPLFHTQRLQRSGIAAKRRTAANGTPRQLWHRLTTDANVTLLRVQSNRYAFIGRGRTVYSPRALSVPISATADTLGDESEPCLSLRGQFVLPASGQLRFAFITLLPDEQDTPDAFGERYATLNSVLHTYDMAVTRGSMSARFWHLPVAEQSLMSRMTGVLAYAGQPAAFAHCNQNRLPISHLQRFGISGGRPILLAICAGKSQQIKRLIKAHAFFRSSGMPVDLVFVCPPDGLNRQELINEAGGLLRDGVFVAEQPGEEELHLLLACARLTLELSSQPLEQQLDALTTSAPPRPFYQTPSAAGWNPSLPTSAPLWEENGYGGFTADGDYQITLPPGRQTPMPWRMPLCSPDFVSLACESGLLFSRLPGGRPDCFHRCATDIVSPLGDENFFLQDEKQRLLWSLTRLPLGHAMPVRITYAPGEVRYECSGYGIYASLQCFTDGEFGIRIIKLKNEDQTERSLLLTHACIFQPFCQLHTNEQGVQISMPGSQEVCGLQGVDPMPKETAILAEGSYQGLWGAAPQALRTARLPTEGAGNTALLRYAVTLRPRENKTFVTCLYAAPSQESMEASLSRLQNEGASQRLLSVRRQWEACLGVLTYDLPNRALSVMLSRWLPYQASVSRLWMGGSFGTADNAAGFDDEMAVLTSLLYTQPQEVRSSLLSCSAHLFEKENAHHLQSSSQTESQSHPNKDWLLLAYTAALYADAAGDAAIWNEKFTDPTEKRCADEAETVSTTLLAHCLHIIDSLSFGPHGLPMTGIGGENDSAAFPGVESVGLGMLLCEVLRLLGAYAPSEEQRRLQTLRSRCLQALDQYAWDGAWYLHGWKQDGQPLGSAKGTECGVDLLVQCWAVLCGVSRERCGVAMANVWSVLQKEKIGIGKLFAPQLTSSETPSYPAEYTPGLAKNSGRFTAACWAVAALHQLGENERAWELALTLLPTSQAGTRQSAAPYRVEPSLLAGDLCAGLSQQGCTGQTGGGAGLYPYVVLTYLLGFQKRGERLRLRSALPSGWKGMRLTYRYGGATYHLRVSRDCQRAICDGQPLTDGWIPLQDDGGIHEASFPLHFGN